MARLWKFLTTPLGQLFRRGGQPTAAAPIAGPRHSPKPATAVVELLDASGLVLECHTLSVRPARKMMLTKLNARLVVAPNGNAHQEFEVPVAQLEKYGIALRHPAALGARLWWSCEAASRFSEPRDEHVRELRRQQRM